MPTAVRRAIFIDIEKNELSYNKKYTAVSTLTGKLLSKIDKSDVGVEENIEFDVIVGDEPEDGVEFTVMTCCEPDDGIKLDIEIIPDVDVDQVTGEKKLQTKKCPIKNRTKKSTKKNTKARLSRKTDVK